MKQIATFQPPRRRVPHLSRAASAPSMDELLASLVKAATPVVVNLLGQSNAGGQPSGAPAGTGALPDILTQLLKAVLGGTTLLSGQKSIHHGRFTNSNGFSHPFVFGIDDALLASLAGPVIQALPQLLNAANQQRLQTTTANNKLITDLVAGVNQRLMMNQLLDAQKDGGAPDPSMTQLLQLLQQAAAKGNAQPPAPTPTTTPTPTPPAKTQSVMMSPDAGTLSDRAVLSFVTGTTVLWNGSQKPVFSRSRTIRLDLKLTVGPPVPSKPLSKAIVRLVLKDSRDQSVVFEKTFKQKNVPANAVTPLTLTVEELAKVPTNRCLSVLAEMRWLSAKNGREHKAIGATEMVLVDQAFVKERGAEVSPERELTDLRQFRPFWNKLWESPVLDAATNGSGGRKKSLWELDVTARYAVVVTTHASNGLMETKLLQGPPNPDSLTEKTAGRLKGGIELSIGELNKLLPLWDNAPPLEPGTLETLNNSPLAAAAGGEFISNIRMKGRKRERGLVWVVPVFKLFEFTLGRVGETNDSGQVMSTTEEKVRFPLPVSARVIGLKSKD